MKFQINKISQLVTIKDDISVHQLEESLKAEGFTLGYVPVADPDITLFDCIVRRVPNLYFLKYGGLPDLCAGVEWISQSRKLKTLIYPRAATGPDLRRVFIGSEELLGKVQEVTLRIFSRPEKTSWCLVFADKENTLEELLTKMLAVMLQPLFVYLGDETEAVELCDGIKIQNDNRPFLAVKLGGLSTVVDLEKTVLSDYLLRTQLYITHPTSDRENRWLNQHLMMEPRYAAMSKRFPYFWGCDFSPKRISSLQFREHFKENSC